MSLVYVRLAVNMYGCNVLFCNKELVEQNHNITAVQTTSFPDTLSYRHE